MFDIIIKISNNIIKKNMGELNSPYCPRSLRDLQLRSTIITFYAKRPLRGIYLYIIATFWTLNDLRFIFLLLWLLLFLFRPFFFFLFPDRFFLFILGFLNLILLLGSLLGSLFFLIRSLLLWFITTRSLLFGFLFLC